MKRVKAQYRGLKIFVGGYEVDTTSDITASDIEILERLKPNYLEDVKPAKKAKRTTNTTSPEPSGNGDSAAVDGHSEGEADEN